MVKCYCSFGLYCCEPFVLRTMCMNTWIQMLSLLTQSNTLKFRAFPWFFVCISIYFSNFIQWNNISITQYFFWFWHACAPPFRWFIWDELCIKSHSSSHTQWLFYMTLAIEHKSKYYCTNIGLDSFQLLSEFYNFLSSSSSFRLFFFCCTISIHLIFIIVWVLAFRAKPCTFVAIYGQCHCH